MTAATKLKSSAGNSAACDRRRDELIHEWEVVTKIVQDNDQRLLTVKGWVLGLSTVALVGSDARPGSRLALTVGVIVTAFLAWWIEGTWKHSQHVHRHRLNDLEEALRSDAPTLVPFQFTTESGRKYVNGRKLLRFLVEEWGKPFPEMLRHYVAIPYLPIILIAAAWLAWGA